MTTTVDRIATANVYSGLTAEEAYRTVAKVLARYHPHAIGLQEWRRARDKITAELGVALGYRFRRPLTGGGPIGLDTTRYTHKRTRAALLHPGGRVDKSPGRRRYLGPSIATVTVAHDKVLDELVTFINYHLTAEVQHGKHYRDDRPLRVRRHRAEVRRLEALIARHKAKGRTVYPMGDGNYAGLRLAGVTSAWEGRPDQGTHAGGNRAIDDVHGPGHADTVTLVPNAGDHDAVVATRRRA